MQWETKVERASEHAEVTQGPLYMSLGRLTGEAIWQYLSISFGRFAPNEMSQSDCQATWPREAIRLARTALDEFEASLDQE